LNPIRTAVVALLVPLAGGLNASTVIVQGEGPSPVELNAAAPNVLLILLDDLGYGDLSCYNPDGGISTPQIDHLARDGMRFTDAHAAGSVCSPSRYGLLTGRYPQGPRNSGNEIAEGTYTLATLLREHGYETAMIGKWHNGWENEGDWRGVVRGGPLGCGFESFFGIPQSLDTPPYLYVENDRAVTMPAATIAAGKEVLRTEDAGYWNGIQGPFWRPGAISPGFDHRRVETDFTNKAIAFITRHAEPARSRPFFLYLAFAGPHTPWLPGAEFRGRSGAGIYGDYVMEHDAMIGRVLAALDAANLRADTLVLLASDNGPVWLPKDVRRTGHDATGPLRGMKADAWEGGHRIPLIASWSGHIPAGSTSGALVSLIDIGETLRDLLALGPRVAGKSDAVSFRAVLTGRPDARGRTRLMNVAPFLAIREGSLKFIDGPSSGGMSDRFHPPPPSPPAPAGQLYNLARDLGENDNLYEREPDTVRRLQALLWATRSNDR